MSNLIVDPNDYVKQPDNDFWSGPVSRRAFQTQLTAIGKHIADLWAAADTAGILLNFIMEERFAKTPDEQQALRAEVEAYVEKKKKELQALREAAIAQVGSNNEQSDR